jgi:hypothetical protein
LLDGADGQLRGARSGSLLDEADGQLRGAMPGALPGLTKPLVTGQLTAVTCQTGPAR